MRRVLIASDFHSGHVVGLTMKQWDVTSPLEYLQKAARMRELIREFYLETIEKLKPIDLLIVPGDCIDGRGERSGGTELLTTDRNVQVKMARDAILAVGAEVVVGAFGTAYHTGDSEDWEGILASMVNAYKWGSVDSIDVNGLIFNYRHHIGGSQTPIGRHTALAREQIWNLLWAERGEYPRADIILRAHVHYHVFNGGPGWLAMTTPALQGYGSKFGARRMSGLVDIGLVHFDITSKEDYSWKSHLLRLPMTAPLDPWEEEQNSDTETLESQKSSKKSSNGLFRFRSWRKPPEETPPAPSEG